MSTETATHPYTAEELAWFAREYGDTEWMVHVTGMDDIRTASNPDLDDDDPANPPFTEESARKFAADVVAFNAWYRAKYPNEDAPSLIPTVFHWGVPAEPEPQPQIEGQTEIAPARAEADR